jgi:ABC-type spermidine/putrescine transport system permease subunit II
MRFFRHAAMFRNYYVFAIAVLALLATRDLAEALDRRNVRIWILFVVAASLMAAIAFGAFIAINAALPNPDRDLTNASIRVGIIWFGLCTAVLLPAMKSGRWVNGIVVLLPIVGMGDALMAPRPSRRTRS